MGSLRAYVQNGVGQKTLPAMIEERNIVEAARNTCDAIENFDTRKYQILLSRLAELWPHLDQLCQCKIIVGDEDLIIQGNFSSELNNIPDNLYFYTIFDPKDKSSICATSLKDGLSDIYLNLKEGLLAIDKNTTNTNAVLSEWRLDYETHWGRHMIDVIRFLFLSGNSDGVTS